MRIAAAVLAATTIVACAPTDEQPADLVPLHPVTTPATTSTTTSTTTTVAPFAGVDFQALAELTIAVERDEHGKCGEWHDLALEVGFTEDDWPTLRRVIGVETGDTCDPDAFNGNGKTRDNSWGLTQINTYGDLWPDRQQLCGLTEPADLLDPRTNLRCAHLLQQRSGWRPWRYLDAP